MRDMSLGEKLVRNWLVGVFFCVCVLDSWFIESWEIDEYGTRLKRGQWGRWEGSESAGWLQVREQCGESKEDRLWNEGWRVIGLR